MENFQSKGVLTKLLVSFSRDEPRSADSPRYVQDNLRRHSAAVASLLTEKDAVVCVCGDAKNMAKDVSAAFEGILVEEKGGWT
jgi:methionine synthase reductase